MPSHFTYEAVKEDEALRQGDLLEISDDLRAVLLQIHPHYAEKQAYHYMLVLTQSCDLVVRGDRCNSRYITLAAVRSADDAISRRLQKLQFNTVEKTYNLCDAERRPVMADFLIKLHNNNLADYFYLAEDEDIGLSEPHVAFLRLSIALKSDLHYKVCQQSRIASLKPVFQAKLGWLVGSCYSRVGTDDWVPDHYSRESFDERIEGQLRELCYWPDSSAIRLLRKRHKRGLSEEGDTFRLSKDDVERLLTEFGAKGRTRLTKTVEATIKVAADVLQGTSDVDLTTLRNRLMSSAELASVIK